MLGMTRKFLGLFESERVCLIYYLGQWHILQNSQELMNPKFCIRIVSDLYQWDKIGTKLGQCVFDAIEDGKLTFSIRCSRYNFNLPMEDL